MRQQAPHYQGVHASRSRCVPSKIQPFNSTATCRIFVYTQHIWWDRAAGTIAPRPPAHRWRTVASASSTDPIGQWAPSVSNFAFTHDFDVFLLPRLLADPRRVMDPARADIFYVNLGEANDAREVPAQFHPMMDRDYARLAQMLRAENPRFNETSHAHFWTNRRPA